jgi:hypothetical protein
MTRKTAAKVSSSAFTIKLTSSQLKARDTRCRRQVACKAKVTLLRAVEKQGGEEGCGLKTNDYKESRTEDITGSQP